MKKNDVYLQHNDKRKAQLWRQLRESQESLSWYNVEQDVGH